MILQILEAQEIALKRGLYSGNDSNSRGSDHLYRDLNKLLTPDKQMSKDVLVHANSALTEEDQPLNRKLLFPPDNDQVKIGDGTLLI